MQVSIVDLRYNMKKVLKALEKSKEIGVLYHGKLKAILTPYKEKKTQLRFQDHPAFGMYKDRKQSVAEEVRNLRKDRVV